MVRQGGGGKIINVTSALGIKGSKSSAHYATSKGGVVALAVLPIIRPEKMGTPLIDLTRP